MEYVTIKITKDLFDDLHTNGFITYFEVKKIEVVDNLFDGDELHKAYKDKANKAYKALKEYEFKKRHGVK